MTVFYDRGSGGFFVSGIHTEIPDGAVEISAEEHRALLAAQSAGKLIVADTDGCPLAVDQTPMPPHVPKVVTMRQARRALLNAGLLEIVDTAIADMPGVDGAAARIDWEFSSEVQRSWPLVEALSETLGLSDSQIDDLFVAANAI